MQRTTIDFGIDLGTTNSVISVSQSGAVETIKNALSEITPSLVFYDKKGTKRVGLDVANVQGRPETAFDVQAEFKREMGQRIQRNLKRGQPNEAYEAPVKRCGETLRKCKETFPLTFKCETV
jgi:molecular chaperone DnaK